MKHRIELFTDGVYAIIITLLVLELRTPDKPGWAGWWAMLPHLAVYFLTFAMVGSSFQYSIAIMGKYREYSVGMLWLHLAALSTVGLQPLVMKNLIENLGDPTALVVYVIPPALGVLLIALLRHTAPRECLADTENWAAYQRDRNRALVIFCLCLFASAGLAYLNFWIGFVSYCVTHTVLVVLAGRAVGSSPKADKAGSLHEAEADTLPSY